MTPIQILKWLLCAAALGVLLAYATAYAAILWIFWLLFQR
jgi:hypothetical protein